MLWWIFAWANGFLLVRFTGHNLEVILNRMSRSGIHMWDLVREGQDIYVYILVRDFFEIKNLLSKTARVKIISKRGFPFWLMSLKRRPGIALGLIFFFVFLCIMGNFISGVYIHGGSSEIIEEVQIYLREEKGVYPGVYLPSVDTSNIERQILGQFPRLSWVNCELRGSQLHIKIRERKILPDKKEFNLYARRSGIVEELILLRGEAQVKEGDTVKKGEVLITGYPGREAQGLVRARTWYHAIGEAPVFFEEKRVTGRYSRKIDFFLADREIISFGVADSPFNYYTLEEKSFVWGESIPGFPPIKIGVIDFQEVLSYFHYLSTPTARFFAQNAAIRELLPLLEEGVQILEWKAEEVFADNIIQVEILLEVKENISHRGGGERFDEKGDFSLTN